MAEKARQTCAVILERALEFLKPMKNGTTALRFPARNERSRTDVPHGTGELSHGSDRRAMEDPWQTSAATLAPGRSPDGLPSRRRQRDPLRPPQWLRLAPPPP